MGVCIRCLNRMETVRLKGNQQKIQVQISGIVSRKWLHTFIQILDNSTSCCLGSVAVQPVSDFPDMALSVIELLT